MDIRRVTLGRFHTEVRMPNPDMPLEESNQQTIVLSEKDVREAARLLRLLSAAVGEQTGLVADGQNPTSREELVLRARIVLDSRQRRTKYFNRAMFGEPAWDVLLALYITERSDGPQSIGRIAEWIKTPLTTVARWIDYLEKERLVSREAHPNDKRVIFIRLLEKGRELLDAYLDATPWAPGDEG